MPITVNAKEGSAAIALSGEIDHHGARAIMRDLDDAISGLLPRRLTLDLSGVTFMDSSGIAVLLRAQRQMEQLGGSLRVTSIPAQPRRVLDAAGVGRLITLE
ncbi:MAG: STAS domain-containing protein [Candidatus Enterenecus sp.]